MQGSPEELWLENQICFPLYAASRMVTQLYTPLLNELDITYPQYLVLLVLWRTNDRSVTEIRDMLHLETNTLTPLLKRMEQKQLITRVRSKADERKVLVSLTEKGRKLQEEAVCIPQKILDQVQSDAFTKEEILQLKHTLSKMVNVFSETKMAH